MGIFRTPKYRKSAAEIAMEEQMEEDRKEAEAEKKRLEAEEKRYKKLTTLNKKFKKLSDTYSEALNMDINYQEGAELSEVVPRIVGAVKKQTEKIFAKN